MGSATGALLRRRRLRAYHGLRHHQALANPYRRVHAHLLRLLRSPLRVEPCLATAIGVSALLHRGGQEGKKGRRGKGRIRSTWRTKRRSIGRQSVKRTLRSCLTRLSAKKRRRRSTTNSMRRRRRRRKKIRTRGRTMGRRRIKRIRRRRKRRRARRRRRKRRNAARKEIGLGRG